MWNQGEQKEKTPQSGVLIEEFLREFQQYTLSQGTAGQSQVVELQQSEQGQQNGDACGKGWRSLGAEAMDVLEAGIFMEQY